MRLFRLPKLLQLRKMTHQGDGENEDSLSQPPHRKSFSKQMTSAAEGAMAVLWQLQVLQVVFVAHLFACFWFFVGSKVDSSSLVTGSPPSAPKATVDPGSGSSSGFGGTVEISGVSTAFTQTDGWIAAAGLSSSSPLFDQYLTSFYWSITVLSTVGYGDVTAHTNAEMIFSIFAELLGCMIFAKIISAMQDFGSRTSLIEARVANGEAEVLEYLDSRRQADTPPELEAAVKRTMRKYYLKTAINEKQILDQLPSAIRGKLQECDPDSSASYVKKVPWLNQRCCNPRHFVGLVEEPNSHLANQVAASFQPFAAESGEVLYEEGDDAFDLFVVRFCNLLVSSTGLTAGCSSRSDTAPTLLQVVEGCIMLESEASSTSYYAHQGSFFGERELFFSRRHDGICDFKAAFALSSGISELHGRNRQHRATVCSEEQANLQMIDYEELLNLQKCVSKLQRPPCLPPRVAP